MYDASAQRWEVRIYRGDIGKEVVIHPKHVVVATGIGKQKNLDFEGIEKFEGRTYHSADHRGAEEFRGKRAVVVGSVGHSTHSSR